MTKSGDAEGTMLGPYRLVRLIGRGGMGEVYEALDTRKDRLVAVKVLAPQLADDAEFRARFLQESRTVARLHDPHVVPIHDFGEIDGRLFLDMRMVDGVDLRALVTQNGALSAQRSVAIIAQIAAALDEAHASGLVHRDVKPENILVSPTDFAYLVDFGLAVGPTDLRLTQTGTAIGSFAYMAPERFGSDAVGPEADVYGLACVLFECLSGRRPFPGDSLERTVAAQLNEPPPLLHNNFDVVIAKGMAKDPADRYPTAGGLAAAAAAALTHSSSTPTWSGAVPGTARISLEKARGSTEPFDQTVSAPLVDSPTVAGYPSSPHPTPAVPPPPRMQSWPPSAPMPAPPRPAAAPRSMALPATLAALVLLVVVLAVTAVLLIRGQAGPTTAHPTTVVVTQPPAATVTSTQTQSPSTTDATALDSLTSQAADDQVYAATNLNGRWVAQLSSKQPGLFADGKTWTDQDILAEFRSLQSRFGDVRLLRSEQWPVFSYSGWWVTVSAATFTVPDDANRWCAAQGFDPDHCFAKFISTTAGPEGSSKYWK